MKVRTANFNSAFVSNTWPLRAKQRNSCCDICWQSLELPSAFESARARDVCAREEALLRL
eukprot:5599494-Pleurochrysis_carterae.AAC.7